MAHIELREADRVEITALVDNYTDWLMVESNNTVKRPLVPPGSTLLAEHGLSLLIKLYTGCEQHTVIMDASVSPKALMHNIDALNVDLSGVEAIMLSHGHVDHFGGLGHLLDRVPAGTSVLLHPDAFLERRINIKPMDIRTPLPQLTAEDILKTGKNLVMERKPVRFGGDMASSLGEIERVTAFEKGFPWAEARIHNEWKPDLFLDDHGIVINLKGKGLIVISGCSHAGIINTVRHACRTTGVDRLHAVLGGFHLTGPIFDPIVPLTIKEMKQMQPEFVVPMHCTGWQAISRFQQEMPGAFLLNTVGTTFVLGA